MKTIKVNTSEASLSTINIELPAIKQRNSEHILFKRLAKWAKDNNKIIPNNMLNNEIK